MSDAVDQIDATAGCRTGAVKYGPVRSVGRDHLPYVSLSRTNLLEQIHRVWLGDHIHRDDRLADKQGFDKKTILVFLKDHAAV